jgi:hypothetical protein
MTLPSNADGLIDDEGNLLGVVNVVDALVVLFVLAILLAGAVLVLTSGEDTGSDRATTYATLDLGTQPDYIVSAINEGDTYSPVDILPRLKTRESTKWIFGLRVSSGCKYAFA